MKLIRVIVADDHPMYRKGLAEAISAADSTELVGVAADGQQAAQLAVEQRPDVALLDIRMPNENGIDATIKITANAPETAVLILTMFDDDDLVFAALRAGARGYILKESSQDEVLHAITTVACGGAIIGAGVANRLKRFFANPTAPEPFPDLTERERQVLRLIAEGRSNAEIGRRLSISEKTVRNNVSVILTKLQVTGRPQAIVKAREAGLGTSARASAIRRDGC